MANTMRELYDTPIAQRDRRYRAWLGDVNWASKMTTGAEFYATASKARHWYLQGRTPLDAVKLVNGLPL